ncbi:hypothetical protein [Bifidobacterium thermophilum]|uniref:hypothetical protein n=1 Tax=Bifidobacterium thermophilum TaxID=33905 RepID=UPI0030B60194
MDDKHSNNRNRAIRAALAAVVVAAMIIAATVALTGIIGGHAERGGHGGYAAKEQASSATSPSTSTSDTSKGSTGGKRATAPKLPASYTRQIEESLDAGKLAIENGDGEPAGAELVTQFGPSPSYSTGTYGLRQLNVAHNVENLQIEAGTYQLTVYCIGTGNLTADYEIGSTAKRGTVRCDDKRVEQTTLSIDSDGNDTARIVTITPSYGTACVFAYQILRFPQ